MLRLCLLSLLPLLALAPLPALADAAAPDDGFAPMLVQFKAALLADKVDAVVALSSLPLRSYELGAIIAKATKSKEPVSPEVSAADLKRHWRRLFPAAVRKNLRVLKALRHEDDALGVWYSVGHSGGKTWSAWFTFFKTDAGWRWTGTDNVSN